MKLLIVICDRKKIDVVINMLNENEVKYHVTFYGKGTADNEMLSYLGLADSEKEIVISVLRKEKAEDLMVLFKDAKAFQNHRAVAFAVPLAAINKSTLNFIEQ